MIPPRPIHIIALTLCTCLLGTIAAGQDPPKTSETDASTANSLHVTLDDAMRLALRDNLDLESAAVQAEIANLDQLGSWGAFDWVFDSSAAYNTADTKSGGLLSGGSGGTVIESESESLDISFSRPLTTGGSFVARYNGRLSDTTSELFQDDPEQYSDSLTFSYVQPLMRGAWSEYATSEQQRAELGFRLQVEVNRLVRQDVRHQVQLAYWDLVSAKEQLGVAESGVQLGLNRLDQNQRQLEAGVGTAVDVIQAQAELASRNEALLVAQNNVAQRMDDLRRLLFPGEGQEMWELELVPDTGLPETVSAVDLPEWKATLAIALARRSDLRQRRLEVDLARIALTQAASLRLYGLDLTLSAGSGSVGIQASDVIDETIDWQFPNYGALLTLSIPLGNRVATYAERSARAGVRLATLAYDRAALQVTADVRAAVRATRHAVEQIAATKTSLQLARRQLEAEEARFDQGLSTTFQVLEFQQVLLEAMTNERDARSGFVKALANLESARGTQGEELP